MTLQEIMLRKWLEANRVVRGRYSGSAHRPLVLPNGTRAHIWEHGSRQVRAFDVVLYRREESRAIGRYQKLSLAELAKVIAEESIPCNSR